MLYCYEINYMVENLQSPLTITDKWSGLLGVKYNFDAGPLDLVELATIGVNVRSANCQRAVQLWFACHGIFLDQANTLSMEGYSRFGTILKDGKAHGNLLIEDIGKLPYGAVVYSVVNRGYRFSEYSWDQMLHQSVFIGQAGQLPRSLHKFFKDPNDKLVFHSTQWIKNGKGKITLWTLDQLYKYYTPVRVRYLDQVRSNRQ